MNDFSLTCIFRHSLSNELQKVILNETNSKISISIEYVT